MTEELSLIEQIDLGMCTEEGEMFQALIRDGLIEVRDTRARTLIILLIKFITTRESLVIGINLSDGFVVLSEVRKNESL